LKTTLMMTLIAIACVLFASSASAQSDRGAITGTVSDGSVALIPGVKVTLSNANTGTEFETATTGTATMPPALPNGVYTLAVEHAGFTSYQQTNIRVQVAFTIAEMAAVFGLPMADYVIAIGKHKSLETRKIPNNDHHKEPSRSKMRCQSPVTILPSWEVGTPFHLCEFASRPNGFDDRSHHRRNRLGSSGGPSCCDRS
jgi:hypothetical protein